MLVDSVIVTVGAHWKSKKKFSFTTRLSVEKLIRTKPWNRKKERKRLEQSHGKLPLK